PQIHFFAEDNRRSPGVPLYPNSIRWTGWLRAPAPGRYGLALRQDHYGAVWLDGKLVLNQWPARANTSEVEVDLTEGPHALRLDNCNTENPGYCSLRWRPAGRDVLEVIPPEALFHDRAAAEKAVVPTRPVELALRIGGDIRTEGHRIALGPDGSVYLVG